MVGQKSFSSQLWEGELKAWFLHFVADLVKTLCILAALYIFWEAIALLRFRGYPDSLCQMLEKTHFAFMWTALCVTSGNFVAKQAIAIWRKKP
jgi:hypothetical protein